jgi:uncharacterized protein YycO
MRKILGVLLTVLFVMWGFSSVSASDLEPSSEPSSEPSLESSDEVGVMYIPDTATYPGTQVQVKAGDVLYSRVGDETKFVGHVAIVDDTGYVIHMMKNGGMKRQTVSSYARSFTFDVYQARTVSVGYNASRQAKSIWNNYSTTATYTTGTPLHGYRTSQYCTKLVWQAYYYTTNKVNLGDLSFTLYHVPPVKILDSNYLVRRTTGVHH